MLAQFKEIQKAASVVGSGGLGIEGISKMIGAALPVIGGITSVISAIGGLFGESPEEKAHREALERNEEALKHLDQTMQELGGTISGTDIMKTSEIAGRAAEAGREQAGQFFGDELPEEEARNWQVSAEIIERAAAAAGLSLEEFAKMAERFGVDINTVTVGQLEDLDRKVQGFDITSYLDTCRSGSNCSTRRTSYTPARRSSL